LQLAWSNDILCCKDERIPSRGTTLLAATAAALVEPPSSGGE